MVTPSEYLRRLIAEQGGSISVERFMQEALYHPVFGYYASQVRSVGTRGDFSTSATLHRALPRAIGAWLSSNRHRVLRGGRWHIIELGGGGGQMAAGVLRSLGWWGRRGLTYHIVEVSRPLEATQRESLKPWQGKVRWHREMATAIAAANGESLIYSNEFVDAFPCVQLERDGEVAGIWREVHITWPAGTESPQEILVPWVGDTHLPVCLPKQRVELHLSYKRWLHSWSGEWQRGRMLTIDYGDRQPTLYQAQPRGTLRGYAHHQVLKGRRVYQNFGQQDLTSDVNFTALERWGEIFGMESNLFCNQAEFLRRHLSAGWLARATVKEPALGFLLDEDGAGGAFKVLVQQASDSR